MAVRPEKVRLQPRPPRGEVNAFPCQVEQVVYVGTDTRFRVRLSDHVTLSVREQNIISTPDPAGYYADTGSPAYAVWLRDAARILIG